MSASKARSSARLTPGGGGSTPWGIRGSRGRAGGATERVGVRVAKPICLVIGRSARSPQVPSREWTPRHPWARERRRPSLDPMRRSRIPRVLGALALVVLALAAGAWVLAGQGSYAEAYRDEGPLPAWARACRAEDPPLLDGRRPPCARVRGRVVWRELVDEDGDGDRHFIVVAERRLRIVKVPKTLDIGRLPRIGDEIRATGYLARGGSGHLEVGTERLVRG